jgi:hypothetical protein
MWFKSFGKVYLVIMERGWDPQVKSYLKKVMTSLSLGLLWMMLCVTAGIYFELGYTAGKPVIYTILFYIGMLLSMIGLIWYLYRLWKKE